MFNGYCYQRQAKKTYNGARADCSSKSGIIAVPNTRTENNFLATTMNPDGVHTWIGYDQENSWLWEDLTLYYGMQNWRPLYKADDYEYRKSTQPVLILEKDGTWQFEPRSYTYQFICEKNAIGISLKNQSAHNLVRQ